MRSSPIGKTLAILGLCGASLIMAAPAMAEETVKENCRVTPDQGPQQGNGGSASEKLNDCDSVLHPPGTGDHDMVQPAPDVGKMPVIPPKAVPSTQNNGNGVQPK